MLPMPMKGCSAELLVFGIEFVEKQDHGLDAEGRVTDDVAAALVLLNYNQITVIRDY